MDKDSGIPNTVLEPRGPRLRSQANQGLAVFNVMTGQGSQGDMENTASQTLLGTVIPSGTWGGAMSQ
jgi:hypothetical protein